MRMTPGMQPQNIPWPEHSWSMAVESFVKRGGGMQKWEVHYFAPNLAVWFLAVPWVSHTPQPFARTLALSLIAPECATIHALPLSGGMSVRLPSYAMEQHRDHGTLLSIT